MTGWVGARIPGAHLWPCASFKHADDQEMASNYWPVLESAHINAGDRRIEAQHLPQEIRGSRGVAHHESDRYRQQSPRDDERNTSGTALPKTGGARSAAADQLGMCRTTLWRNMKEYGLERDDEN